MQLRNFNADENAAEARRIRHNWHQLVGAGAVAAGLVVLIALVTALALARAVRQLAHATEERADELEAFSGRVAHDLVGPLSAAVMTLALVAEERPEDALLNRRLERLTATLRRASTLVRDLYEYAAAGGHGDPLARAEVGEVLRDVVVETQARAQREAEIVVDQPLPATVACRPGVLVSIMSNLIDNALKHIGAGHPARVAVHVLDQSSAVRIEVEDNGPGIPAERLPRLFEPYSRGETGVPGLGLGLATVKRLTERHGGAVGVRSAIGAGSTFWLELPKAATRARA
jgi:signal transduction histidine kinase